MADIAVIHPDFGDGQGGARKISYTIASDLSKDNEVTHITSDHIPVEEAEETYNIENYERVNKLRLEKPLILKVLEKLPRLTLLKKTISDRKFIQKYNQIKEGYDLVIFTASILDFSQFYETGFEKHENTIIYQGRYHLTQEELESKNWLYRQLLNPLGKIQQLEPEQYLFNSQNSKDNTPIDKGKVVYPPVETDFNYNDNGDGLVFLGRISEDNNVEEAVEIAKRLDKKLKVVGFLENKKYLNTLKDKSGSKTTFETDVSNERKSEILEDGKFGINCNLTETFGIKTIEYMKAGLIPIVRDNMANKETVQKEYLRYNSINEACKIIRELDNESSKVQNYLKSRKDDFGVDVFKKEIRSVVDEVLD